MHKPDTVRLATAADIHALFWLLMRDLREDNSLDIEESPPKVLAKVTSCCNMEGGVAGVIDGPNGSIIGSIGIVAEEPWFSDKTILGQVWLFVSPQSRRGERYGQDLFDFAEWHRQDMSQRVGYDMVMENTVWSLHRLPAKMRLWERFGTQIGATYWSRGPHGDRQDIHEGQHDRGIGPGGAVGVPQPSGPSAEYGGDAVPKLQRPTRSPA